MYIDLNLEVKTNAEFRYKISKLTAEIAKLERSEDPLSYTKIDERVIEIYRICKYNAGLLLPYFFPQYPNDKPFSCRARPYAYAMFHMQIGGYTCFRASRQIGKELPDYEMVLTPSGWRMMGTIRVGDWVFDINGHPTQVTGVFPQGVKKIYTLVFDDSSKVDCGEEHLWVCKIGAAKKWHVETFKEIKEAFEDKKDVIIPLCKPIQFSEKAHVIPPHARGKYSGGHQDIPIYNDYIYDSESNRTQLLLGFIEGCHGFYNVEGKLTLTIKNYELAQQVRELVESLGGKATVTKARNKKGIYEVRLKLHKSFPGRELIPGTKPKNDPRNGIRKLVKIKSASKHRATCITVASKTKTFITRHSIVTHNSSSLAARQLIYSHIVPRHRSLYIVPHQSFLDTYANRLREMERAFRFYQPFKDFRQNLKYKEYPNGSVTMLVKCLTDTQEARSKTCSEALFDESVHMNTTLPTYVGGKIVGKNISGMLDNALVVGYDMHGNVKPTKVLKILNKGKKHVWKLKFSNGSELICTGNTRFWTSKGWMFLCEFLSWEDAAKSETAFQAKTLLAIREAATPGDSSWRRVHAMGSEICGNIQNHARSNSGSLLQKQGKCVSGLYTHATEDIQEWRLGGLFLPFLNSDYFSIQFYTSSGLPTKCREEISQDSNKGMAGPINLGRNSMVVPGRWNPDAGQRSAYQHAFFSEGRGTAAGGYAGHKRNYIKSSTCEKRGESLLPCLHRNGEHPQIYRKSKTFCTPFHVVQNGYRRSSIINLSVLPEHVSTHDTTDQIKAYLLSRRGVQNAIEPTSAKRIYRTVRWAEQLLVPERETAYDVRSSAQTEEERNAAAVGTKSRVQTKVGCYSFAMEERQQAKSLCAKGREDAESRVCRENKSSNCRAPEQTRESHTQAGVTKNTKTESKNEFNNLEPVYLISAEYDGMQEVWDIETETKTFFANGIAIHNCQLLDPEFIPDIEQCQKSSERPSTIYAGTSTTMESLLETKYLDSSQSAWFLRAPGYVSASAGAGWVNCGDKDDVLKCIRPQGLTNPATGRIIDVTDGHFVHREREAFEQGYVGFHIPQIIIPDYANKPQKWMEIWNAYENYDQKKFLQEILGIPTEEGMRELSLQDIKNICILPETPETLKQIAQQPNGRYKYVIGGCDWGGSDYNPATKTKASFTVHVIIGITWDGLIDILHIRQYAGMDYRAVANAICEDHKAFNCIGVASDYGVGAAYNMLLRENPAVRAERHFIFNYTGPQASMVKAPASGGWFNQYALNRTDSITTLYQAIRDRRIRCYHWDLASERLLELLNLFRVPVELPGGGALFKYQKHGSKADDTLHALNFAFCLARIALNEPLLEDPVLRQSIFNEFNPGQAPQFFNPHGGWDMGGVISG